jgi:hypothetical protein
MELKTPVIVVRDAPPTPKRLWSGLVKKDIFSNCENCDDLAQDVSQIAKLV